MKKKRKGPRIGKRKKRSSRPFPPEFKLKVVRLLLEEGYPRSLIAQEFNIAESSVGRWARQYRQFGEQGLQPKSRNVRRTGVPGDVKERIVDLKRSHPSYGTRRIADVLKRFFLIRTSPSTVRRTLSNEGLIKKPKRKPKKNPSKPRFFERATPNQLWQTDIMTFRLAGRNAYLIGYLDDYSRYITACGFYRSQTAEHVLETYRRAISEYGVPREMLTDNGRQYTNWRGTTRFERELKKDRVKHIKSRPHHPMTLGKIERFWKTIQTEFFHRVQFTSYDEAVERCALWVKYYNYKRPHQGIGGLCPADRFFEIQHALKKTLEKGIEENALELALRGKPRDPFYMVGRMGSQSVVIRAEKGKVKMLVDDNAQQPQKELVYDAGKDIDNENDQTTSQNIRPATENHGRVVDLDGAAHDSTGVSGDGDQPDVAGAMAESGHRGDAKSIGPEQERSPSAIEPSAVTADRKEAGQSQREAGKTTQDDTESQTGQRSVVAGGCDEKTSFVSENDPTSGRGNHESALRSDERQPGSRAVGNLPKDLLQVGAARPQRIIGQPGGSTSGTSRQASGQPSAGSRKAVGTSPSGQCPITPQDGVKGDPVGLEIGTRHRPGEKKMSVSSRPLS